MVPRAVEWKLKCPNADGVEKNVRSYKVQIEQSSIFAAIV